MTSCSFCWPSLSAVSLPLVLKDLLLLDTRGCCVAAGLRGRTTTHDTSTKPNSAMTTLMIIIIPAAALYTLFNCMDTAPMILYSPTPQASTETQRRVLPFAAG